MFSTKKSADTQERSFSLTKRHTEDTDEAILQMRGEVEPSTNIETIQLNNVGKVSAHDVTAHFEIWRNELPGNNRMLRLGVLDISQDELRINDGIVRRVILPDMGQLDWERMTRTQEGISVSATIEYENGFGDHRHPSDCQEMVMVPPYPNDHPQVIRSNLVPCDNIPAWLEEDRLTRKRFTEQQAH
jgi:hypothetical protein